MADKTYRQADGQSARLVVAPTVPLAANSRAELRLGVLLFPGESLGFNNTFTGGADLGGSVYVVEEAL